MNRAFRRGHFRFPALIPAMTWKDSIPPLAPTDIKVMQFEEEIALTWKTPPPAEDGDTPQYYVVYRFEEDEAIDLENSSSILSIQKDNTFRDRPREMYLPYTYVVTSVDRLHNESIISTSIKVKFDVGNLSLVSRNKNVKIIALAPELEWAVSQTLFHNFPLIDSIKRPKELEIDLTGK